MVSVYMHCIFNLLLIVHCWIVLYYLFRGMNSDNSVFMGGPLRRVAFIVLGFICSTSSCVIITFYAWIIVRSRESLVNNTKMNSLLVSHGFCIPALHF